MNVIVNMNDWEKYPDCIKNLRDIKNYYPRTNGTKIVLHFFNDNLY